jgi:hypothetical protein
MNSVHVYIFFWRGGFFLAGIVFVNHAHGHAFFSARDVLFSEALIASSERD